MARYRFVDPDVVRLQLSDGDWVDVKKELNVGEGAELYAEMALGGFVPGEKTTYDRRKIGLSRAKAYLVAWSLTDKAGKPAPLSALKDLQQDTFMEIIEALDQHIADQEARREQEKKLRTIGSSLKAV